MANPSKVKGDSFERHILHEAEKVGLKGYRNRMSRANKNEHWDICVAGRYLEAKKRAGGFKQIERWLAPGTDGVICGADYREPFVVLRMKDYLNLLT